MLHERAERTPGIVPALRRSVGDITRGRQVAAISRRPDQPAAKLFLTGLVGRAAPHHHQSHLVVHQLGRRRGAAFIPLAYRPGYLPWKIPAGLIALFTLTMLGFLTANFVGRKLVEARNILSRMPVVRPIYKASSRSSRRCSRNRARASAASAWSVSLAGHVVVGVPVRSGRRGYRCRLPDTDYIGAFMPCTPNPAGFFFYVPRRHRSRHLGRGRDDAVDVGGPGAAGGGDQQEACGVG